MTKSSVYPDKLFTSEKANRTLPLVSVIVHDLVRKSRNVMERRQRLHDLTSGRSESAVSDPYSEELDQIQGELERDIHEIERFEEELRELGVEAKNGGQGIIGFPAMVDGEIVHLCWKLGDAEVLHWHRVGEGYVDRQPLNADRTVDSSDSGDSGDSFEQ